MRELQPLSMTEDSVMCPQHGGEVSMIMLAPDIVIGDLDASYHIPRHQLVLNENKWVGDNDRMRVWFMYVGYLL